MAGSPILGLVGLILTAGACAMTFLVILAGITEAVPLRDIYFMWANTGNIPNAPSRAQWTLWGYCQADAHNHNINCTPHHAAYPFVPQDNFGTTQNIPHDFLQHRHTYYYLSRFMFAFFLISIFFMVTAFFTGMLSLCSRLGSAVSAMATSIALFFLTTTACLMTACFVLGKSHFHSNGQGAGIGVYAFAFVWASVACLFLSMVLFCLGFAASKRDRRNNVDQDPAMSSRGRLPFFRGRRASPAGESEQQFT